VTPIPDDALVIVGAGASGLALAVALVEGGRTDVVLVEAPASSREASPDRTWCYWEVGDGPYDDLLTASWEQVDVVGNDARRRRLDLAPFRYKMLSSSTYLAAMKDRLLRAGGRLIEDVVRDVWEPTQGRPRIAFAGSDGPPRVVPVGLVYDTRPASPATDGTVELLQHFRGWFVRSASAAFDHDAAVLMDFRPRQPQGGVAFGYILPTSPHEALVEYTEFTRHRLRDDEYDEALTRYVEILGLTGLEVTAVEDGAIPMTDASFPRRLGARCFRLGAAGGATRPSTGYTFAAAQRQARATAEGILDGSTLIPPPAFARRHLAMDRLMLQALDSGRVDGADFFLRLFDGHPPERVLRFLDGATAPHEDLAIMRSAPMGAMLRTIVGGA
jgi:lycopene beta-cyclase